MADQTGSADDRSPVAGRVLQAVELLGDLNGPVAAVDHAGTVAPLDAGWQVGWAVGGADRWRVAAEEAAVRTGLVDGMPVVATAMRVPGGDVIQRAAAISDAAGRGVVLEFVNETPTPVSLALAVSGSINAAQVRGSRVVADGTLAVELDRTPGGAVAVDTGQAWEAVRSGPPAGDCAARSRSGQAAAAVLVPLATGVPLRVTVPAVGGPVAVQEPEKVAAGWLAVVSRAASLTLPDELTEQAWRRGIAASVLAAGGREPDTAARAAAVLDRVGLPDEADRGRAVILEVLRRSGPSAVDAVAGLGALASRRLRGGRVSGLAEWAGPLAKTAGDDLDASTLEQVATALELEAPAAARDARRLLAAAPWPTSGSPCAPDGEGVAETVRRSVAFGGDSLAGIEILLDCLVAEAPDQLLIAPAFPHSWRGASVDARSLATRHGRLSFSVRWHGSRAALLWELLPPGFSAVGGADERVTLFCGLDPSWSASSSAGEALLALDS